MDKRKKFNFRLNIMSIVFAIISLISVTLAWFAYSGLAKVDTEVAVKSWYIEFKNKDKVVSSDITISLDDVKPGMDIKTEEIIINNKGDSDALVKYEISSVKILNEPELVNDEDSPTGYIEDAISHDYPFHINMSLDKNYSLAGGIENKFKVSVSWPLDSGDDELDSLWGNKAYQFQKDSQSNSSLIKIVIKLTAEQFTDDENEFDYNYDLGKMILYDVTTKKTCNKINENCIRTHVIDVNNKVSDKTVTLLPSFENNYQETDYYNSNDAYNNTISNWSANTRKLSTKDIINIISTDITNSFMKREGLSDIIIGNLSYNNRINNLLTSNIGAEYLFINNVFPYISSNSCYWLDEYGTSLEAYNLDRVDDNNSKVSLSSMSKSCKVVPVIIANKSDIK